MDRSLLGWSRVLGGCLLVCCIVGGHGCQSGGGGGGGNGPPAGDGTVAGCAGQWVGVFGGDDTGSMSMSLSASGGVSGMSTSLDGAVSQITAQVSDSGTVTGQSQVQGETSDFSGQLDLNTCTGTGTWSEPITGGSGTWTAARS